jgi:hypothetical protein
MFMGFLKKLSIFVLSNVYIKRLKVLSISGVVWFGLVWWASLSTRVWSPNEGLKRGPALRETPMFTTPFGTVWDWAEYPLSDG